LVGSSKNYCNNKEAYFFGPPCTSLFAGPPCHDEGNVLVTVTGQQSAVCNWIMACGENTEVEAHK